MIPDNISYENVVRALDYIDNHGVPAIRTSRKWFLVYNNQNYPPKYCISLANQFANGQEHMPSAFITNEAVAYLLRLGFHVRNE